MERLRELARGLGQSLGAHAHIDAGERLSADLSAISAWSRARVAGAGAARMPGAPAIDPAQLQRA